eukprot:jgi/Tetstr1/454111/TSEL_041030.t1
MPLFTLPSLSSGTYHDGEAVAPGDTVVPVLAVVDANRKTTFVRGSAVTILDLQAPAVSGFAVTQDGSGYTFAPSAGTVRDYTHEAVSVYHVIALAGEGALNATELLALVQAPGNAGQFGSATVSPNTPGQEVALSGLSLGTSKVYGGGSFREIAEGDVVRNYLLAVNPESNTDNAGTLAASSALSTGAVADRTPPAGLGSVTLGAPTNDQIPVQNLDAITDAGDGVSSISVFYNTADDFGGATEVAGVSPPTYNLSGLSGVTEYHVWVTATDGTNAAAEVKVGTATTLDAVDPVISMFDASQTSGYAFAADAGTLSDNANGPLKAYMLLAASQQTTGDLRAILVTNSHKDTMEAGAKDEAFAYTAPGAVSVSSLGLSATQYWTGSAWAAISDAAPAAPHQLWAHLYVMDSSGNDGSAVSAGSIKTVADVTAPAFGGSLTAAASGQTAITVSGLSGWSDGRELASVTAYCGETAPSSDGVADVETWAGLGTTFSASAVSPGTDDSAEVTGLAAGTAYHVRSLATDGGGNKAVSAAAGTVSTDVSDPGPSAPVADYEPDFAAALLPYSQDLSEDVVTASGNGDDGRVYLDANPFPMAGQSLTFVSIARYSQDPVSGTAWYMYRDAQSANRPRVTFTGTNFSLSGASTSDESTTAFPAGFFTSKFLFAFTFETGTRAVNAYLVGKPGGTLTTRSLSAVTNATRLEFGLGQIFWAPDSPAVAYLRKFKFWTSVLSQAEIEAVATAEL